MKKILLIEDNELNRDMLSRRLRKRGYEVVTAVDGETGIAMAQADAPALILMDVTLPGIDGLEATRRLKAAPQTRHIPIVALTAQDRKSTRLNSSHSQISYAVFCLKKKKTTELSKRLHLPPTNKPHRSV